MKLLTEQDAAGALGVDAGQLQQWRESGQSPPYYRLGSQVRYRQEDLDGFLEDHPELWQRCEPAAQQRPAQTSTAPPPIPPTLGAASELTEAEIEARRQLVKAIAEAPTGLGFPAPDKIFYRQAGEIQADDGTKVDAPDPLTGFRPDQIGGCGFPPEDT